MTIKKAQSVPFDPGFSKHNPALPDDIFTQLDLISKIKLTNQRKFKLQIVENALIRPIKTLGCIYYGCVMYGSTIASKYKSPGVLIEDNPILNLSEEEKKYIDLSIEAKSTLELFKRVNKDILYNFRRQSHLIADIEDYIDTYIEFVSINDHFKNLESTDQIKLPKKTAHFKKYTPAKLEEIEQKIIKIAQSKSIEEILNIS